MPALTPIFRWLMAVFYIVAGIAHFVRPGTYLELMPPYLPWHLALVWISGVAEIVLGVGVLIPRFRRICGWGLIALLIAVFPANVHAAMHGILAIPAWVLWARLPFQFVFVAWAWWCCIAPSSRTER
ncbi:MAG: MauE/DoxX family redox-associated membrane protein [Chthoniobacteraceae bacterium]